MAVYEQIVPFLSKNTDLMVIVKPHGDIGEQYTNSLIKNIPTTSRKSGTYVLVRLLEDLNISFNISKQGNIHQELIKCSCVIPSLNDLISESLNGACQEISHVLESYRNSKGGKVYARVYCLNQDTQKWELLNLLRERLFRSYSDDFTRRTDIIKERLHPYLKPQKPLQQILSDIVNEKDSALEESHSRNKELQSRIETLADEIRKYKISDYESVIKDLRVRLHAKYKETAGKDAWQKWIYTHSWIFGVQYTKPIQQFPLTVKSRLDFLFPTPDGFVDILEIKLPSATVLRDGRWTVEVSNAISQGLRYIREIEQNHYEIKKRIKEDAGIDINILKPRVFILIGMSNKWTTQDKEVFRHLNHENNSIEILTYTDLLQRGENLIRLFREE